jgi:predicted nucleic acid-binding protein
VLAGFIRRGVIAVESARRTAGDAEAQMREHEYAVPTDLVLDATTESTCSAYDCEFVVLARQLSVSLVTADRRVLKEFPSEARSISHYVEAR